MAISVGEGSTLSSASFTSTILRFGGPSIERAAIKTSSLATTGGHTYIPSNLVEGGTVDVTIQYDASNAPEISTAAETFTINIAGSGLGCNFSGFLTSHNTTVEGEALNTADVSIKIAGDITWTTT